MAAREVDESELADLHLVTAGEPGLLDPLAVEVGAVQAADVADDKAFVAPDELCMPAGDRDVVKEDVTFRVPSRGRDLGIEQEATPRVRPALDHEQRRTGGQR